MDKPSREILVVEDDPGHANLICHAFRDSRAEFRLTVVGTLAEAQAHLARQTPDLTMTDLHLPDGSGLDLLQGDKETVAYPIVVMTAYGEEQVAVEAMKAGALDYIVKSTETFTGIVHSVNTALRAWNHILKRRQAEEALRKAHDQLERRVEERTAELLASEQRFRSLIETTPHGIQEWSTTGQIVFCNTAHYAMTGYEPTEIEGKHAWDFFVDSPDIQLLREHIESGNGSVPPQSTCSVRVVTKRQTEIDVQLDWNHKHDDSGGLVGFIAVITDITQRKKAEQRAIYRLEQLACAGRINMMGQMIEEIAHDVNQPLHAISNYAGACTELLKNDTRSESEKLLEWTGRISKQACRTGKIIHRLRRYVHNNQSERSAVDISVLVADVVELMDSVARTHRILLKQVSPPSLPEVSLDRIQVEQVVVNLLQNAIDAMSRSEHGQQELIVETSREGEDCVCVAVHDCGKQLTAEELEQVFNAFYTTKKNGTSMGMGLAICRSIVDEHGGRIWATGNEAGGTSFFFTLPVKSEDAETALRV